MPPACLSLNKERGVLQGGQGQRNLVWMVATGLPGLFWAAYIPHPELPTSTRIHPEPSHRIELARCPLGMHKQVVHDDVGGGCLPSDPS